MAKKASTPAKARPKGRPAPTTPATPAVTVRMYAQGLGDCFLLTFRAEKDAAPVHVLIDCGVFQQTPGGAEKIRRVAEDIREATGGVIDLLVVTHEHWDHVSGFADARATFDRFEFRNVWLSWAEDPDDPDARALKDAIGKDRARLAAAAARAGALAASGDGRLGARAAEQAEGVRAVLEFFGADAAAAGGRIGLEDAMEWVRGKVKRGDFCSPGECRPLPGLDAVKVYVLGPPRSVRSIRKEDPSKGQGYGLLADRVSLLGALEWAPSAGSGDAPPGPFDPCHRIRPEDARVDPFFRQIYGFDDDPLGDGGEPWRRIDDEWLGGLGPLALRLDVGVNNTSLALAFELPDGRTLIFPGDAQIGNWLSWKDLTFRGDDRRPLAVTTRSLLNRAVLYKVGHHGSHNATLKPDGLEAMTGASLVAMIPTDRAFAAARRPPADGWKMPRRELLEALMDATGHRVLMADFDGPGALTPGDAAGPAWEAFLTRVAYAKAAFDAAPGDFGRPRPLYVEYTIPL